MTTTSERLRESALSDDYYDISASPHQLREAAYTIDALVAALELYMRHARVSNAVEQQADAGLVLARKGGG